MREYLLDLRNNIIKKLSSLSSTMLYRMSYDIDNYNSLVEDLGFDELRIISPNVNRKVLYLGDKAMLYLDTFEDIADTVIDMYKDMNYVLFRNKGYSKLSGKDQEDILKDFLSSFCPDVYDIYKELIRNNHMFKCDMEGRLGEAFLLPENNLYFFGLNKNIRNDLEKIETIIHELMHIYGQKFLSNYRWNSAENVFNGFYSEAISLYSELRFYEYMVSNHICSEAMHLHANYSDYFSLVNYKTIKYLAMMSKKSDAFILYNGYYYQVEGNNTLDIDKGIPLYQYPEHYSQGDFSSFIYAISMMDAYDLLRRYFDGDKNIINNYLISLQNENKFFDDFNRDRDLTFMRDELNKHKVASAQAFNIKMK